MTNSTNTDSGSIAQGQSVAAGERGIAADSISGSTIATGDNPTINNIVIVGRLLEFAQVEGLLPQIKGNDFSSIAEAVEGALNARFDTDLAEAVAFAGEILGDFVEEWIVNYSGKPIPLAELVYNLIDHVGHKLEELGYWEAYTELTYDSRGGRIVLKLEATTMLHAKKTGNPTLYYGIVDVNTIGSNERYHLARATFSLDRQVYTSYSPKKYDSNMLRIFIAGIVLDLIRIYSDNRISVQFLQELSNLFRSR